jgi:hypothetical protein
MFSDFLTFPEIVHFSRSDILLRQKDAFKHA